MQNTQEVELRAKVPDDQVQGLEQAILNLGASPAVTSTLHDIYFCPNHFHSFEDVQMDDVGSYSLRTRSETKNGEKLCTLNSKTITSFGDHHSWEEHEVQISDFKEAGRLLISTGFKPFFEIKKTRKAYKDSSQNLSYLIDIINDFGTILELEILTTPQKGETAKAQLYAILTDLKIPSEHIYKKSATYELMRKWAFRKDVILLDSRRKTA